MASPKTDVHPFTDSTADVIFCSSDNVHFRLHKLILSLASGFFKDMFSLPQPLLPPSAPAPSNSPRLGIAQTDELEGLPLVHVTETSVVLESLFRLCYPIADPPLQTIEQVRPTLEAALKYQMYEAIYITTQGLLSLVQTAPLRVFAIACRLSLHNIIGVAALAVREQSLQDSYVEELEDISVDAYHQLLKFFTPRTYWISGFQLPSSPPSNLTLSPKALGAPQWTPFTRARPTPACMADLQGAEIIIQTVDGLRLGVSEYILNLSSSVWRELILNARSTASKPPFILEVPELSDAILPLLELSYPISPPSDLTSIEKLPMLIIAARKYKMLVATKALEQALWRLVDPPPGVPGCDRLLAYFAGCQLDMRAVAQAAAARTLRVDIVKIPSIGAESFGVAAGHLWRLLEYHRRCRAAVCAVVEDDQWVAESWRKKKRRNCFKGSEDMPCWWKRYLAAIAKEPWPSSASATSESVLQEVIAGSTGSWSGSTCSYCTGPLGMLLLLSISKYVAETMDAREKEVRLQRVFDIVGTHLTRFPHPGGSGMANLCGVLYDAGRVSVVYTAQYSPSQALRLSSMMMILTSHVPSFVLLFRSSHSRFMHGASSSGIYAMILIHASETRALPKDQRPLRLRETTTTHRTRRTTRAGRRVWRNNGVSNGMRRGRGTDRLDGCGERRWVVRGIDYMRRRQQGFSEWGRARAKR